jgi:transposase
LEALRPDVVQKRAIYARLIKRVPTKRLVFLDESGLNCSMTRGCAWVKRGAEYVERVPMNWGKNLTLIGAIKVDGWVVLSTMFETANTERFQIWLRRVLLPKLRRGDVLVMDNWRAHRDRGVVPLCARFGVRVIYLPPYSPDLNPIEPGWALQKQYVRKHAPRDPHALRRVARRARYRVTQRHCRNWFAKSGYQVQHN